MTTPRKIASESLRVAQDRSVKRAKTKLFSKPPVQSPALSSTESSGPKEQALRDFAARTAKDVVAICEQEQKRLRRELHDGYCQDLTAIAFFAETIAADLATRDEETASRIRMLVDMLQKSAENVDALAAGLDVQQVQELGLAVALDDLASRISRQFSVVCTAKVDRKFRDGGDVQAIHLYRIVQEALNNAARHSQAHTITLRLRRDGETGILQVHDDGIGFPTDAKSDGFGLRTMHYRASIIKGTLKIDSKPGSGTTLTCSFPVS